MLSYHVYDVNREGNKTVKEFFLCFLSFNDEDGETTIAKALKVRRDRRGFFVEGIKKKLTAKKLVSLSSKITLTNEYDGNMLLRKAREGEKEVIS